MKSLKYMIILVACLFAAVYADAQVGIGRDSIRGVLDVNDANGYGNKWGVVLPVARTIEDIKTPNGNKAIIGTIAFDSIRNCIRVMKTNGWSDCLLDEGGYRTSISNILSVGADFRIKFASMGPQHTLCIGQDDNAVYAAGNNGNTRTGIGRTSGNCQTFMLIFAQPCVSVAAGSTHSIAVDALGQVWSWGQNADYRTGLPDDNGCAAAACRGNQGDAGTPTLVRFPNGDTIFGARPTSINGKAIQCAAGLANSYVLTENGKVWSVGTALASGTGSAATTWTQVNLPEKAVYIAASGNSCGAVTATGKVYVWGAGAYGKLGTGAATNIPTPTLVSIPGNTPIGKIAMGFTNGAAISTDGTQLFVWGTNRSIGNGTNNTTINPPLQAITRLPGFSATDTVYNVAAARFDYGNGALAAVTSTGVFTTGENTYGQLGVGNTTDQILWQPVNTAGVIKGTQFTDAAMSGYSTIFLTAENPVQAESSYAGYGTGRVYYRELGAITVQPSSPTQLTK